MDDVETLYWAQWILIYWRSNCTWIRSSIVRVVFSLFPSNRNKFFFVIAIIFNETKLTIKQRVEFVLPLLVRIPSLAFGDKRAILRTVARWHKVEMHQIKLLDYLLNPMSLNRMWCIAIVRWIRFGLAEEWKKRTPERIVGNACGMSGCEHRPISLI